MEIQLQKKNYEQLNEFKDDLHLKIYEMEQLLKQSTIEDNTDTSTTTNNDTSINNSTSSVSFGKKKPQKRHFRFHSYKHQHHRRSS